jgi:hypothetical protein
MSLRAMSLFLLYNSLQCMRIRMRRMPGDAEEAKPPLTRPYEEESYVLKSYAPFSLQQSPMYEN